MNTMIKGALIFGGLAAVSVLVSRCHASPTEFLKCPDTVRIEQEFTLTVYTAQRVDEIIFFASDGGGITLGPALFHDYRDAWLTTFPIFKDSIRASYKIFDPTLATYPYIRAVPMYYKTVGNLVPVPLAPGGQGGCRMAVKPKLVSTGIRERGRPLIELTRTGRSILGRIHAFIR